MIMKNSVPVLTVVILLSGCATAPHNIRPAYVDPNQFSSLQCEQIEASLQSRQAALRDLEAQQRKAAKADAIWFTVGTLVAWPAYFGLLATDNHEDEIARLRGEVAVLANQRCSD